MKLVKKYLLVLTMCTMLIGMIGNPALAQTISDDKVDCQH